MLDHMYPFWAAIISWGIAQVVKPFFYYLSHRQWIPMMIGASGGFPSSHSATVSALTLSVGLRENFDSTLFVITLVFSLVVIYDAANVRYYAGQNIRITQQLIKDLQILPSLKLDDPIYYSKVKEVLGHKWVEVIGGCAIGLAVAYIIFVFFA